MNITSPSIAELKKLVASIDDNAGHHVMWIDLTGEVSIARLNNQTPAEWSVQHDGKFKTRLETMERGNNYLGPEAAEDDNWMEDLMGQLKTAWAEPGNSNYYDGA